MIPVIKQRTLMSSADNPHESRAWLGKTSKKDRHNTVSLPLKRSRHRLLIFSLPIMWWGPSSASACFALRPLRAARTALDCASRLFSMASCTPAVPLALSVWRGEGEGGKGAQAMNSWPVLVVRPRAPSPHHGTPSTIPHHMDAPMSLFMASGSWRSFSAPPSFSTIAAILSPSSFMLDTAESVASCVERLSAWHTLSSSSCGMNDGNE